MTLNTPVAFFIFNRPHLSSRVFERIAQVKPRTLMIVADGPRTTGEADVCHETRKIVQKVDWECDVLTNFSEINLGCKYRVASGLDWVFSQVEEAIILEDDCLPTESFFFFCQTLLEYYRDDHRIFIISGDNFQDGQQRTEYSYYFSKYPLIWGWASWRRAWNLYDVEMKAWPEYKDSGLIQSVFDEPHEEQFWDQILNKVFEGQIDTWDYQMFYTGWSQHSLSIIPNTNLVSNIGFGPGATHSKESCYANLPTSDIWDIKHPPFVCRNRIADVYDFHHAFSRGAFLTTLEPAESLTPSFYLRIRQSLGLLKRKFFL